jgi:hypothetical protein
MACTTIAGLFLFAMLGIVAIGALRSPANANTPVQRKLGTGHSAIVQGRVGVTLVVPDVPAASAEARA